LVEESAGEIQIDVRELVANEAERRLDGEDAKGVLARFGEHGQGRSRVSGVDESFPEGASRNHEGRLRPAVVRVAPRHPPGRRRRAVDGERGAVLAESADARFLHAAHHHEHGRAAREYLDSLADLVVGVENEGVCQLAHVIDTALGANPLRIGNPRLSRRRNQTPHEGIGAPRFAQRVAPHRPPSTTSAPESLRAPRVAELEPPPPLAPPPPTAPLAPAVPDGA
jgi:hypothetical protein